MCDCQCRWGVESEFVVSAAEILYERVSGDDHGRFVARSWAVTGP